MERIQNKHVSEKACVVTWSGEVVEAETFVAFVANFFKDGVCQLEIFVSSVGARSNHAPKHASYRHPHQAISVDALLECCEYRATLF